MEKEKLTDLEIIAVSGHTIESLTSLREMNGDAVFEELREEIETLKWLYGDNYFKEDKK